MWAHAHLTSCFAGTSRMYPMSISLPLSCCLNVSSDDCEVSVVGRLFHTCAAATGKARSPRVRRWVIGTSSQPSDASGLGTDGKIYWIVHANASLQLSLFTFYEVASCDGSLYMYLQYTVGWVTGRASIRQVRQLSCYADDSDLTRVEVPTATNAPWLRMGCSEIRDCFTLWYWHTEVGQEAG